LYRRIGVALHPDVESNSDPNTLALVRLIVEAAIQKYGRLDIDSDVRLKGDVQISSILGGLFEERWSKLLGKDRFKTYASMLSPNQWVIVDFTPDDYVSIYAIEGLAYQYWRCTAKMRALAKGSEVKISTSGELVQTESLELYRLIQSYDRRIDKPNLLYSNAGLIARVSNEQGHPLHHVLHCTYNARRLPVRELPALYGQIDGSYIPNFLVGMVDARAYLDGHRILAKPFEKKYSVPLEHVIALMAATSIFALGRLVALDLPMWRSIFELTKRAYRVLGYSSESLSDTLFAYAQEVCNAMSSSTDGLSESVATFLHRYSLTSNNQVVISLWTYGPRAIFDLAPEKRTPC
jgi:hypothetical protein